MVLALLDATFTALLEQMGPMIIERRPGGRWFRDLGVPLPSIYGPSADENPFMAAQPAAAAAG